MTLVDPETGEVVAQSSPEEARQRADRIKVGVEAVWHLVVEAYQRRDWAALGYASWDDYQTREFGTARLRLPREERQEVVSSLRDAGLSIRAIAAATGNSDQTVQRDLRQVKQITTPARDVTPNFKNSAPPRRASQDRPSRAAGGADSTPAAKVTGTDGKTYKASVPSKPRRAPITDAARTAGWDLRKVAERLQRICDDDRFPANKEEVAALMRSHLSFTVEVCHDLLDLFGQPPTKEQ